MTTAEAELQIREGILRQEAEAVAQRKAHIARVLAMHGTGGNTGGIQYGAFARVLFCIRDDWMIDLLLF